MPKPKIFHGFFLLLLAFMLFMGVLLLAPFFGPLLLAAVLAIVFYPLHLSLGRWKALSRRPTLHALASDLAVLVLFIIPFALIVWAVLAQSGALAAIVDKAILKAQSWAQQDTLLPAAIMDRLPTWLVDRLATPADTVRGVIKKVSSAPSVGVAARIGTQAARNTLNLLINAVLMVFSLFFFFRDGERWYDTFQDLLPMPGPAKKRLDQKIHSTIIGVVRGSFIVALAQSIVAVIGFALARVPGALFLGLLMFVSTIIPAVGHVLVWGPVAIYYAINGALGKAAFIALWSILVTGLIDNVLRPFVVGNRVGMPVFWLFFSIMGGLQVFGIKGALLGPLVITIIPVLLDIYREVYLHGSTLDDNA